MTAVFFELFNNFLTNSYYCPSFFHARQQNQQVSRNNNRPLRLHAVSSYNPLFPSKRCKQFANRGDMQNDENKFRSNFLALQNLL